jgi:hypothetical protein
MKKMIYCGKSYYSPAALPNLKSIERAKNPMVGIVAFSSGSMSVYNSGTN